MLTMPHVTRRLAPAVALAAVIAIAGATPSARADLVYSFSFGNNAAGTFATGAAASDAGFFLVTSFRLTTFVDAKLGPVPVAIAATSAAQFSPGAAYNPTTGAFINHFGGSTFANLGDIGNTGQGETATGTINGQAAYVFGPSFNSGQNALLLQGLGTNGGAYTANGVLVVSPQSVPEPSSLALCMVGIASAAIARRRARSMGQEP